MCLCAYVSVGKRILKNTLSRVAKTVEEIILDEKIKESHWIISVPDTIQGSSFCHYFSYFLLSVSWLHPFEIARGVDRQQLNYARARGRIFL